MVLGYLKAQKAACTLKNKVQAAFEGRLKTQKSSLHLPSKIKGVT